MTDLETAFAECGEQLDRIIDAYERKGPEPYVPTNFPVAFNIVRKSDSQIVGTYKLNDLPNESPTDVSTNTQTIYGNSIVYYEAGGDGNIIIGFNTSDPIDVVTFITYTFVITSISGAIDGRLVDVSHLYEVQWVDPSTLPQS